jgi:GNAT superfamily N-acetyltransferase
VIAGGAVGPGEDTSAGGHVLRPATAADLPVCAAIWRESINDYLGRLAQPEIPDDLGPILRLYSHLQATDPARFVVAESGDGSGTGAIAGFVSAVVRDDLWFLSMLFIRPAAQARGLGRALLRAVAPDDGWSGARATATDSVQPISNGLYASLGLVPRVPLLRLVGLPERRDAFPALPAGIEALRFDEVDGGTDGLERSALHAELSALDRELAGFDRAADRPFLDREGRSGFLYRAADGAAVGYAFAGESGRVGPVAVRDEALLGPVLGHLLGTVRPRGAFAIWVPGSAGEAVVPLLRAGFRIDGFPCLLCWDRPFADFGRCLPISPGLL